MEEFEFTLLSYTSTNAAFKPSFLEFRLSNKDSINLRVRQQNAQKISFRSEDVSLSITIYDENRSWIADGNYRFGELRHNIQRDNSIRIKTTCQDNQSYIILNMKVEFCSLQPLNGSSLAVHPNVTARPSDSVLTTNPHQRQLNIPQPIADFIQNRMDDLKTQTIKALQEKVEGLEKSLSESESTLATMSEMLIDLEGENDILGRKLREEQQKATEAADNLEMLERCHKEDTAELQQELTKLRGNVAAAAVATSSRQPIDTGIYPLDQVDPLVIAGSWRSIYDDLHYMLVEELGKRSLNSAALEQYQKLTYHTSAYPCGPTYSRHYAYAIVREISSIISKISRRVVLDEYGSFEYSEKDDFISSLMEYTMVTSDRRDFAERILSFLAPPNSIDAASARIFENLPGGPKAFFENLFEHLVESLHEIVTCYGISADTMDSSFKRMIYSAIYTTLRTTVVRGNFMSFWSNVTWDRKILNLPCEDRRLAYYKDKFNNNIETLRLHLASKDPQVAFTVFPGFLYVNNLGEIIVIERSQVICCKKS